MAKDQHSKSSTANPARPTAALQMVMFQMLMRMLDKDGLGASSQSALCNILGVSKAQISNAVAAIRFRLEGSGMDSHGPGAENVLEQLRSMNETFALEESEEETPTIRLQFQSFYHKSSWEDFMERAVPAVWKREQTKELWEIRKMEAWLRGSNGSELPTTRVALAVAGSAIMAVRRPHATVGHGWEDVPEEFRTILPKNMLKAMGIDRRLPQWFVDRDQVKVETCSLRHDLITALESGHHPLLQINDGIWIVHRVRRFGGRWLFDCMVHYENDFRSFDLDELDGAMDVVRNIPAHQLPHISFCKGSAPDPMAVDHPLCRHLGLERGETFLLDHAPDVKLEAIRSKKMTGQHDLPKGWGTLQIHPRYTRAGSSDPAFVEFVSLLLPLAGRIRLRVPENAQLEQHPMLGFCTGPIDKRLLDLAR